MLKGGLAYQVTSLQEKLKPELRQLLHLYEAGQTALRALWELLYQKGEVETAAQGQGEVETAQGQGEVETAAQGQGEVETAAQGQQCPSYVPGR
jgi:hypothetical protein